MNLNGYTLKGELQNANSGFSKWGFATKNGREYFVKELITPVFPTDGSIMSDAMYEQKCNFCYQFENKFRDVFGRINRASHGNLVRAEEFFRMGGKYYIITEKVSNSDISVEQISTINLTKKILLLKSAAHCFYDLHSSGIVHFDVKPTNLMIKVTRSGNLVARLIDFDSGFLKGESLETDELGGDLTYLAPETFLAMCGENVTIDEKSDIFALGLVFHEYFCGKLPFYDENEYEYPYQAALDEKLIIDNAKMPKGIYDMISSMLSVESEKRPSAADIINSLNEMTNSATKRPTVEKLELNYSCFVDGSPRKRKIIFSKDGFVFSNLRTPETSGFPEEFFQQKERKINFDSEEGKAEFEGVLSKLNAAGLFSIVSYESAYNGSMREGDGIKCNCDNGMLYSFSINGGYTNEFIRIIELLASYCDFPRHKGPVSTVTTPPYHTPMTPSHTTPSAPRKADEWFSQAGDL